MTTSWIANHGINQSCVQRFAAVPSMKFAKKAVWIFVFGLSVVKLFSCFVGLIVYTRYGNCDPVKSGKIQKLDQILPFFVMEVASKIPGLPGLFIAGIFSAALSSMSSSLNTIAGTIYEDFISPNFPKATEKRASDAMKFIVVLLGIVMIGLVFVVERMGQVFSLHFAITGLFAGTQLGMFTVGMMSRTANTKGIVYGAIGAILTVGTIIVGSQIYPKAPALPIRTDGCDASFNVTTLANLTQAYDDVPTIFKLSFMYYTILGAIVLCLIALPVSWYTGDCEPFDERYLTPMMRSKEWKEKTQSNKSENNFELNLTF